MIVFSFSKRDCETHALNMAAIDFNSADEKACVEQVFTNAMAALSEADRHLPQVDNILPLLRRGIGIHHGGLLPILKEVVEILFQSELLKVLFSTETFSMGLNMPCRCTVFTDVKKCQTHMHTRVGPDLAVWRVKCIGWLTLPPAPPAARAFSFFP